MTKLDVWAILEAAEAHVPAEQTDHYGDPLWGERTVGGDGWSFHCECDGGSFDGFI